RRSLPRQRVARSIFDTAVDEPLFEVVLSGGMAERHRLPLDHVIRVLQRIHEAIREIGKVVQRENGIEVPTGDFGIELLATNEGFVFTKSSVRSTAAITKDQGNGKEAVRRLMKTANHLEKKRPASISAS